MEFSPESALLAWNNRRAPPPPAAAVERDEAEERRAFEAWAFPLMIEPEADIFSPEKDDNGEYRYIETRCAWLAWRARAGKDAR